MIIASGPAQSVRKRLQYPVSERMFMKMSGAPCWFAYSRSWCTGMKSREAMAPATTRVTVTSMTIAVISSPAAQCAPVDGRAGRGHVAPSSTKTGSTSPPSNSSKRTRTGAPIETSLRRRVDVGDQTSPFLELDEGDDVRHLEKRQRWMMRHHEAVHAAAARRGRSCPTRASGSAGTLVGAGA